MFCGARCIARGEAKSVKKKLNGCGKTTKVSTLAKRVCNMSSGLCGDRRVRSSSVLVLVLVCFWSGSELCCAVMPRAMRVCKISNVSYLLPRHLSQTMARSLMMTAQDKAASIIKRPPHMSFIKAFMTASHCHPHPRTMLKRYGICDSIQIADFYFHSRYVFFFFLHFYTLYP